MGAGSGEPTFPSHPSSDPVQGGREPSLSGTGEAPGSRRVLRLSKEGSPDSQPGHSDPVHHLVRRKANTGKEGERNMASVHFQEP